MHLVTVSRIHITVLLISLISFCGSKELYASSTCNPDVTSSFFDRIAQNDVIKVTIASDFSALINSKYTSKYQPAIFTYRDTYGENLSLPIKIKTRGKYRLKKCDFPPTKIKFRKSDLNELGLKEFNTLKIVTHCSDLAMNNELALKELLCYQLYNVLTDHSYRVQLARINWIDTSDSLSTEEQWGFFIESDEELAYRIGGQVQEDYGIEWDKLHQPSAALQSIFQYMIANCDWQVQTLRNVDVIGTDNIPGFVVVPYDFDFCGLIKAPYAAVEKRHNLSSLRDRVYLGESSEDDLQKAIELTLSRKKELLNTVKNAEYLSNSAKRDIMSYLRSYFNAIKKEIRYPSYYNGQTNQDNRR